MASSDRRRACLNIDKHELLQEKLKATYYLWQLYHTRKDASAAQKELEKQEGLLKEAAKQLKATDASLKEKKKVVAGLVKEKLLLEQKTKKRKIEVEKKASLLYASPLLPCKHPALINHWMHGCIISQEAAIPVKRIGDGKGGFIYSCGRASSSEGGQNLSLGDPC